MGDLVSELINEHKILEGKISKLKEIGISSSEGKKLLISMKEEILDHLKKEDENLYPKLFEIGLKNPNVKMTVNTLSSELESTTRVVENFFSKYTEESSELGFFKEFGRLITALMDRMRKEETALYPIYVLHNLQSNF